jgi:hypothetical protein
MKHFVISLKARRDRRKSFSQQANSRFDYEFFPAVDGKRVRHLSENVWTDWVDPLLNRTMNVGEIGCLLSHHALWQKCIDLNEPIVIFEDDVQLLEYDPVVVSDALTTNDFVYISRKAMGPDLDNGSPGYSYWLCAYAITPAMANILVNTPILQNMIPADEYVPAVLGVHPNPELSRLFQPYKSIEGTMAFTPNMCEPFSRSVMGSDIEGISVKQPNIKVVSVASDKQKAGVLIKSCKANNIDLTILGLDEPWAGGDMSGPGGGQKLNLLHKYLQDLAPEDVVLFVDGYDVVIHDDLETIYNRFLDFDCDILFAAEKNIWPDESIATAFPEPEVGYRYLNSGCFIGYVDALRSIVEEVDPRSDDQLYYQMAYLSCTDYVCKLDHEQYVFACLSGLSDYIQVRPNGQLFNSETRCCSSILHGNGGDKDKYIFGQIVEKLGYQPNVVDFVPTTFYDVMDTDMLTVSFLDQDQCKKLIKLAEDVGSWTPMPGDKFPAQEIRLRDISPDLYSQLEDHWTKYIKPLCEQYWSPMLHTSIRDAFVMKYTVDTQRSLPLHHDASLVTASIKLNDDYEGADLVFPRQSKSNKDIPVGEAILFPGQVTHGHMCEELISGTKYSLTIWTSRYAGDINR